MSKKENFKKFVSLNPDLVKLVANKKHTWQELFEVYDLYGNDKKVWDKYLNAKDSVNIESLTELTKVFKNVNLDTVQKYITTAEKIVGVMGELTKSDVQASGPISKVPIGKIFED